MQYEIPNWVRVDVVPALENISFVHFHREVEGHRKLAATMAWTVSPGTGCPVATYAFVSKEDQGEKSVGRRLAGDRLARLLSFGHSDGKVTGFPSEEVLWDTVAKRKVEFLTS
jgi:hypothetical protein